MTCKPLALEHPTFAMHRSILSGLLLPKMAVALCVLGATMGDSLAQEYPPGQKPRLGKRVLNFVRELVTRDDQEDIYGKYRPVPPPQSRPQRRPGGGSGQRYNLDQPPPEAGYAPSPNYRPTPPPPVRGEPPTRQTPAPARKAKKEPAPAEDSLPEAPASRTKSRPQPQPRTEDELPTKPAPVKKPESKPKAEETPPPVKSKPEPKPEPKPAPPQTASTDPVPRKVEPETKKPDPPAPTPPTTNSEATLTGTRTSKAGLVKSPYAPYNELDVTGLPPGSLAMDPTTGKVFRVP